MIDLLMGPIDPSRMHELSFGLSWHGRLMVFAWGVLSPAAILMARYFKVMPGQNWPHELDNKSWWRGHWMGHTLVMLLSLVAIALILASSGNGGQASLHRLLGYTLLLLGSLQLLSGLLRGSKGGPTAPAEDGGLSGDHYDMTPHRLLFERVHKIVGYLAVLLMTTAILTGLWQANGPVWMWIVIIGYWICLVLLAIVLQLKGKAVDTYQAIWGPDLSHPGNRMPKQGWCMFRPEDK